MENYSDTSELPISHNKIDSSIKVNKIQEGGVIGKLFGSCNKVSRGALKAANDKKFQVVEFMIEENLIDNYSCQDEYGKTLLHYLIRDFNLNENYAVYIKMILSLKSVSSFINLQDKDGNTPLIMATKISNHMLCDYLIKHGADKSIKNNEGIRVVGSHEMEKSPGAFSHVNSPVHVHALFEKITCSDDPTTSKPSCSIMFSEIKNQPTSEESPLVSFKMDDEDKMKQMVEKFRQAKGGNSEGSSETSALQSIMYNTNKKSEKVNIKRELKFNSINNKSDTNRSQTNSDDSITSIGGTYAEKMQKNDDFNVENFLKKQYGEASKRIENLLERIEPIDDRDVDITNLLNQYKQGSKLDKILELEKDVKDKSNTYYEILQMIVDESKVSKYDAKIYRSALYHMVQNVLTKKDVQTPRSVIIAELKKIFDKKKPKDNILKKTYKSLITSIKKDFDEHKKRFDDNKKRYEERRKKSSKVKDHTISEDSSGVDYS